MSSKRFKFIASTMMILPLFFLFLFDLIERSTCGSQLYMFFTVVCTIIYFAIFYMHIKCISTQRWKWTMIATFFAAIAVIFPMRFYLSPGRWDFQYRLLFVVDFIAILVLLLFNFIKDTDKTILFVILFASPIFLLYVDLADQCEKQFNNYIITTIIVVAEYFIILWLYVKHAYKLRGKVVIILIFILVTVGALVLWYEISAAVELLFYLFVCIDALLVMVLWLWMKALKVEEWWQFYKEQNDENNFLEIAGLPRRFTLKELIMATGNFETPTGKGGSGMVFKGVIDNGSTVIAVKQIMGQLSREREFSTEITIIASLQHVNLVHLLGYCLSPKGDRYLIYPFFENGSLDSWIFAEEEKRSHLTWAMRYNIAIDVVKALAYLHHDCHHRILHLDIKPGNILLDGSFKALVSDFGISKLIARDQSSVITRARGTRGYLAPEMLVPDAISPKVDIYSYGLVLLELVGGGKNIQSIVDEETQQIRNSYFPKVAREKMMQGKLMEVVDESLMKHNQTVKEDEVTILVEVALWCIQESPELRPSATELVDMLEGRKPVHMPPESPMFVLNFLNLESPYAVTQALDKAIPVSLNTISISIQSGR